MTFGALWRSIQNLIWRWKVRRSAPIAAFWNIAVQPEGRTPQEIHALLDLWGFEAGDTMHIYLAQTGRFRWHKAIPSAERHLLIENSGYVRYERVTNVIDVIRHLAAVLGVELDPP